MRRLVFDRERCGQWALERIPYVESWGEYQAIGYERNGELIAVCVFNFWTGYDMAVHIAANPGALWCTREFLTACFRYAFVQHGCRRVTGYVPAKNTKALRLDEHLGFVYEGRKREALADDDLVILGMTRSACRYLETDTVAEVA